MPEHQQTQQSKKSNTIFQKQATLISQTPASNPFSIIQRAKINPKSLTYADIMQLQRTIGNRAVGMLLTGIGNTSTVQQAPVQRQEIPEEEKTCPSCMQRQEIPEEEEPLQGKMAETVQRQEIPEEEKPLQGKTIETVQRQEIPEEEEPLQGKFESIQRQEIPEEEEPLQTKRENNTGMQDNLKAGVENLSGIDMSDVRVHYNSSKPAEVGALAYTQGTNIHVAPGQERHLPHEAWHVVQQAQNRVKPTIQLRDGISVNDDTELEHEANNMGEAALIKDTRQTLVQKKSILKRQTIQRKMGFEFEAGGNKVLGKDRKFVVYEDNQFSLEADTHEHVEFVTKPFDKKSELLSAVSVAANLAQYIATKKNEENKYEFKKGGNTKNNATIEVNDKSFFASAQSTEGVKLEDLGGLIQEHIGGDMAKWSKDDADKILEDSGIDLSPEATKKVHGLIQYIALYVRQVMDRSEENLSSEDGPKACFRLMARTDFNSMFRSIIPLLGRTRLQQTQKVSKVVELVKKKLPDELDLDLDKYVFCKGNYYEAGVGTEKEGRKRNIGPKLGEWIESIFTMVEEKDIMSPPPGYEPHRILASKERYGMGAYGMDDDKVLVEMRGYRNKLKETSYFEAERGLIPYTQWRNFAERIFNNAKGRNTTLKDE